MTLFYPVPERLPDPRARFLQIVNTCHAVAREGEDVELLCGLARDATRESLLAAYGLPEEPRFRVEGLPMLRREGASFLRISWHLPFHAACILRLYLRMRDGGAGFLFVRHLKLAQALLPHRRRLGMPLLFEVHELFHRSTVRTARGHAIRRREERVYENADAVVCLSERLRDLVLGMGVPPDRVHVVPHAVRDEWFAVRRSPDAAVVGYVGSLYPWKGVDTFVRAMKRLPGRRAAIVGGGGRLPELRELAAQEGVADRVDFVGAVPHAEVPRRLSSFRVAVLPNSAEEASAMSSPLKMFEYMAAGVPIAAADLPIFREVLVHGENALLFPPGDEEGLAGAVGALLADTSLADRIATRARRDAENYTYQKRARRILEVARRAREGIPCSR